jgi:hypothetical protein
MNNAATTIEMLFEKAEDYGKTSIELLKLNAIDKSADVVSSIATKLAIAVVAVMFISIINIGLSLWIGELLGKLYYGFFVVAGFYGVLAMILYTYRSELITTPISNSLIIKMLKERRRI